MFGPDHTLPFDQKRNNKVVGEERLLSDDSAFQRHQGGDACTPSPTKVVCIAFLRVM
jgi:hypothetical protein